VCAVVIALSADGNTAMVGGMGDNPNVGAAAWVSGPVVRLNVDATKI
jgi:hypothetical protein